MASEGSEESGSEHKLTHMGASWRVFKRSIDDGRSTPLQSSSSATPRSSSPDNTPPLRKKQKLDDSFASSSSSSSRHVEECVIIDAKDKRIFSQFKDWCESMIFIVRDEEEHISKYIRINVNISCDDMDWPGSFLGCTDCKLRKQSTLLNTQILKVPWPQLRQHGVPNDVPDQVRDMATCARGAAACSFANGKIKQFVNSVLQHCRLYLTCPLHASYITICHPKTANDSGGVSVLIEGKCAIVDTSDVTSESDVGVGYTQTMYLLKGKPDVSCILDSKTNSIIVCVEGKKHWSAASVQPFHLASSQLGQLLFYLLCSSLDDVKKCEVPTCRFGLYLEGQKGIMCNAKTNSDGTVIDLNVYEKPQNHIDVLSSSGLINIIEKTFNFIQKSLDS